MFLAEQQQQQVTCNRRAAVQINLNHAAQTESI